MSRLDLGDYFVLKEACLSNASLDVQKQLERGCDPNTRVQDVLINGKRHVDLSLLSITVLSLFVETTEVLLKFGAKCDKCILHLMLRDNYAFYDTKEYKRLEIVRLLLDKGVQDVNECDSAGRTLLCVELYHQNWARHTPLSVDPHQKNTVVAELLLEKGADVHHPSVVSGVFLHDYWSKYDSDLLRLLVKYGFDIEQKNRRGRTPLQHFISERRCRGVSVLLELGANPWRLDNEGKTPFQHCYCQNTQMSSIAKFFATCEFNSFAVRQPRGLFALCTRVVKMHFADDLGKLKQEFAMPMECFDEMDDLGKLALESVVEK